MNLPLLLGVPEAAKYLGLGRDAVYRMVNRGEIPSVRVGRRRLVPRQALERWVEEAATTEGPEP